MRLQELGLNVERLARSDHGRLANSEQFRHGKVDRVWAYLDRYLGNLPLHGVNIRLRRVLILIFLTMRGRGRPAIIIKPVKSVIEQRLHLLATVNLLLSHLRDGSIRLGPYLVIDQLVALLSFYQLG